MNGPISYRLQFIDSAKVMASSLLNLVNNLSEGVHKIKCKYGHDNKKIQNLELNTKIVSVVMNIPTLMLI